jgi:hypothetical protein
MGKKRDRAAVTSDWNRDAGPAEPSPADLAFLIADIAEEKKPEFEKVKWKDLGEAEGVIKKVIADQSIDLTDKETSVEIRSIRLRSIKETIHVVDVQNSGGGSAPDPLRYVYLMVDGKYIGSSGKVAS